MAPIGLGETIPDCTLTFINDNLSFERRTIHTFAAGKKVILFGVPGAFMSICSKFFIPHLMKKANEFKSRGVQEILCLCVNDPVVVRAWSMVCFSKNKDCKFVTDIGAAFVKSLGLDQKLLILGVRPKAFAMYVDDLKVKAITVEIVDACVNLNHILKVMDAESNGETSEPMDVEGSEHIMDAESNGETSVHMDG